MWLGVEIFGLGKACSLCAEALDAYGHHIMGCMRQGSKYDIHNCLRNTVFRYATMVGLRPALEPIGLLSDDPLRRPADTLIVAPPSIRPNSWRKYPRLAIDLAVTSPFQQATFSNAGTETLFSAKRYAERKRRTGEILERCAAVNVGYEPMVFESTGGIEEGGQLLLKSICKLCDEQTHRKSGENFHDCMTRITFDLQRGLQAAIRGQRVAQEGFISGPGAIQTFLDLCTI